MLDSELWARFERILQYPDTIKLPQTAHERICAEYVEYLARAELVKEFEKIRWVVVFSKRRLQPKVWLLLLLSIITVSAISISLILNLTSVVAVMRIFSCIFGIYILCCWLICDRYTTDEDMRELTSSQMIKALKNPKENRQALKALRAWLKTQ